ncbi:hypothetical protein GS485_17555 [Rhodococcus hoagii]|nr:hypothetical protein [Prescottella equi]
MVTSPAGIGDGERANFINGHKFRRAPFASPGLEFLHPVLVSTINVSPSSVQERQVGRAGFTV